VKRSVVLCLVLLLFTLVGAVPDAQANGRFPASNAIVFHPGDPNTMVVRVTFGLLISKDAGASWKWICERGIGFSGVEDPSYVITPKGTLVAGTFEGAAVSRDGGCDWSYVGGKGANVFVDLTLREDGEIVGVSSVYDKAAEGKSLYANAVMRSTDDGQSFEVVAKGLAPGLLLESIEVARSDRKRIYVSAIRGEESRKGLLLVSNDGGATFTERDIGLIAGERAPFIAEVDPTRPDRVYVRTSGQPDGPSRLLLTEDAGKTFRTILAASGPLSGFALTRDGTRVFAGGRETGIHSASTVDLAFAKVSPVEAQCLGALGTALWACSNGKSGFFVGLSENAGKTFNPKLQPNGISPLTCGQETSVGRECVKEWPRQREELGIHPDTATPANSGGTDAGPPAPAMKEEGGRARGGSTAYGAPILVILALAIGYWVVKRMRRGR
jgi:hypothetical protein